MSTYFSMNEDQKEQLLDQLKKAAYGNVLNYELSKAEASSPKGKLLLALAEKSALQAEIDFLRDELRDLMECMSELTGEVYGDKNTSTMNQ